MTAQTQEVPFPTVSISGDGNYILAGTNNLSGTDSTPPEDQGNLFLSTDRGSIWKTIKFPEPTY